MKFKMTDLIYRVPKFLSKDECQFLIEEYEFRASESDLEHCPDSTTGIDTYSTFSRVVLKVGTEAGDLMFRKTEQAVNQYLDYLDGFGAFHMSGLRKSMLYSHVYRLLKYSVGGKIHPHTDHDAFGYGSVTFNLNEEYTGGVFKFFNGQHSVRLKRGEMMIWPADYFWVHEVTPIKSGVRYSTNSFLLSIPVEVRDEICANTDERNTSKWFEHHGKVKPDPYTINHK